MGVEIERKFLVTGDAWRDEAAGREYRQGYLAGGSGITVRVRIAGDEAWLCVKGPTEVVTRAEFEYAVPRGDAEAMLTLCARPPVEKTRYPVKHAGRTWEIDEFHGANAGLVMAEVELESAEAPVELPPWAGEEVSHDSRYFNAALAETPFSTWDGVP